MINHPNRKRKSPALKTPKKVRRAPTTAPHPAVSTRVEHDREYHDLLIGFRTGFENATRGQTRLFTTTAAGLWETYLDALPDDRHIHDCRTCRHFIRKFGHLVCISDDGKAWSPFWNRHWVPDFYKPAFARLAEIVEDASVNGLFCDADMVWGKPLTGEWAHLSVTPGLEFVHRDRAKEPNQRAAAVFENVKTVHSAMAEYGPAVLDQALRMFNTGLLARSEKFTGPLQWLRNLHNWPKGLQHRETRNNMLWKAVATAPEGYSHIKSSVLGPLLDDIKSPGARFEDIARKHAAKLNPLQYQRPQAAPAAGNVKAAEDLVEKLGIKLSLERRFARLEELPLEDAIWTPVVYTRTANLSGGVFSHLQTKGDQRGAVAEIALPQQTMTWVKFVANVLIQFPSDIRMLVPAEAAIYGLTTAVHADAPPILKWDMMHLRNPFSAYTYVQPMPVTRWKLVPGCYAKVNAIVGFPNMWGPRPMSHMGIGAMLILEGCQDTRKGQGNALFPESLNNDLHGVRSTIEAYSKHADLTGRDEASACGLGVRPTMTTSVHLRVQIGGAWSDYLIDRWD